MNTLKVRRYIVQRDEVFVEGGRRLEMPLVRGVAAAIFTSPWEGRGFVEDLWDEMNAAGEHLAPELGGRILNLMGGIDGVQGFGKFAVVGVNVEIEHGAGIIHGPALGPKYREMVQGTAGISAVERRSGAGFHITVPTNHKTNRATRAFYQSVDVAFGDAPHPDELVIGLVAVGGPRAHERIGDLTTDAAWSRGER